MNRPRLFRSLGLLALPVAAWLTSAELAAQPSATPPAASATSPAPSTPPAPTSLAVWVDVGHSGLDRERIRGAIERELGSDVTLTSTADTPLRVTIVGKQLQVAYATPSGESLSRTVELPDDGDRGVEVIALMVGNLTRDEAADLVEQLRRAREAKAKPPEPEKPAEKPIAPKPTAKLELAPLPHRPINVSLFHPLALYNDSQNYAFTFELGLLYSRVGAIEGVGVDSGVLVVERHARGITLSSLATIVKGPIRGVSVGGVGVLSGPVEGIAIGGAATWSEGTRGAAIAGAAAIHRGPVQGLSIAGAFTSSHGLNGIGIAGAGQFHGDSQGIILSGGGNLTKRTRGLVIAGGANVASDLDGFALAGGANVMGDVDGAELAVVNVGRVVNGVQIGVVNVASEVHGTQIGLVNVAKTNRYQLEAFTSNLVRFNAGLKVISGFTYSELLVGYQSSDNYVNFSPGFGAHLELPAPANAAAVELGARGSFSYNQRFTSETPERMDLIYEGRVTYSVLPFVTPFVGGGVRHGLWRATDGETKPEVFAGIAFF